MKTHPEQPAYPCMPSQDNLGRVVALIPGFTKYEEVLLRILCSKEQSGAYNSVSNESLFRDSMKLADIFFDKINSVKDDSATTPIIKI
jgi:hypothetical protein